MGDKFVSQERFNDIFQLFALLCWTKVFQYIFLNNLLPNNHKVVYTNDFIQLCLHQISTSIFHGIFRCFTDNEGIKWQWQNRITQLHQKNKYLFSDVSMFEPLPPDSDPRKYVLIINTSQFLWLRSRTSGSLLKWIKYDYIGQHFLYVCLSWNSGSQTVDPGPTWVDPGPLY